MLEPVSVALKFGFLAVLYLFLLWVARSALKDMRRPGVETVQKAQPAPQPPPDATGLYSATRGLVAPEGGGIPLLRVERAVGLDPGSAFELEHEVVLGRGSGADIQLEDTFASSSHARIARQGSVMVLEDLGSTNGTYLNGEPLRGPQPLHHGDRIRIGDTEFSYEPRPMLRVAEHFARTDTGRQRPANEDAYFERAPLFLVADGMGGAQAGEVAAQLAVEAFEPALPDHGSVEERLATRAREANERIHALAEADAQRAGMGTTLSAVYVGEDEVTIAHVGDSRIYVLSDGELTRLTRDHSLVQEYIDRGKLTEAEAEDHPQRSIITRALGPEPDVEIDTRTYPAKAGDVFLICSDGLTSMVPEAQVRDTLLSADSLREAGIRLIDAANAAGGRDNITVVLLRVEEVGAAQEAEAEAEAEPEAEAEQATVAGPAAPKVDEVRAAIEEHERSLPPEAPPPPLPPAMRRRRRALAGVLAGAFVLAILLAGGWFASRAVYFLGTDDQGIVTVYRGLPYDLPAGVRLYSRFYTSGVPAASLPERRRKRLLDHKLRSESDASDLMRQIEEGQISS